MIGRNVPLKRELIEQSSLLNLLIPHHDSVPSRRLNQRISPSATADFFNKIDPKQSLNVAAHCNAVGSGFLKRTCDDLQKRARIKPRVARDCGLIATQIFVENQIGESGAT